MLHIVSSSEGFSVCKRYLLRDDLVLFLGEGVYSLEPMDCEHTYAITEDVVGRGISLHSEVTAISYDDFVHLVVSTSSSVTWK